MTEESPKKPRRKRRTKAQIEADKKAAEAAKALEQTPVVIDEPVKTDEAVTETPVESVVIEVKEEKEDDIPEIYIPKTGMEKFRLKMQQRQLIDKMSNR